MKRNNGFFCLLSCLALIACEDDDYTSINPIPDTVSPVVKILTPAANDSILIIDKIEILAEVTDDNELEKVQVLLTEPGGGRKLLSDNTVPLYGDNKNYILNQLHYMPKYTASGEYIITVEAKDKGQNVTKNAVKFNLYAPDIRSAVFKRAFGYAFINTFSETLDWFGYNLGNFDNSFNEVWLSTVLYLMVSTDSEYSISEAEWEKFMADFGIRNQTWATWDENRDNNLNDDEFHNGITKLNLFNVWDNNQNNLVHIDELADGLFILWDTNKDDLLSREEYLEKFYSFLHIG